VLPDFGERNTFVNELLNRGIIRSLVCEKQLDESEEVQQ
jgi:hypothetical protein